MTYKLYWAENTGAFAPHAALQMAGAEYEILKINYRADAHKKAAYLRLNPMGQIPLLILPDGTALSESVAIILHIAEAYPQANLLPGPSSSQRAIAYKWLLFMATNTYNHDLRYYYPHRFTADKNQVAAVKQSALEHMDHSFDLMNAELGNKPYLTGDYLNLVDVYLTMLCMWRPDIKTLFARCRELSRVCHQVKAQPVIAEIWADNFPDVFDF